MLGVLNTIFGSGDVIKKGVEFIDGLHYSDQEKAEDRRKLQDLKTKNKIDLMNSYAPFKVAQRYLAVMFTLTFLFSFFLTLGFALYGKDIEQIVKVLDMYNIGWIQMAIVTFYFGGGLADSVYRRKS